MLRATASLAIFCLASTAGAATFCVGNVQDLQNALTTAQNNGEDDLIKVKRGTYLLNAPLGYGSSENHALTLVGGYLSLGMLQCALFFPDPARTVLDGQNQGPLIDLSGNSAAGAITVSHLTFRNGVGANGQYPVFVGGFAGYSGAVTVDDNIFAGLTGRDDGGYTAVQFSVDQGSLVVRNNLFTGNTTESGIQAIDLLLNAAPIAPQAPMVNPNGGFNNNTVTANDAVGWAAKLHGSGFWSVANNIAWGNPNFDLLLEQHVALYDNDIGSYQGTPSADTGNVSIDPGFVDSGSGNYRLRGNSPLLDQGVNAPYGGIGAYDAGGNDRVVFGVVDIGAYELQDGIFADGFE